MDITLESVLGMIDFNERLYNVMVEELPVLTPATEAENSTSSSTASSSSTSASASSNSSSNSTQSSSNTTSPNNSNSAENQKGLNEKAESNIKDNTDEIKKKSTFGEKFAALINWIVTAVQNAFAKISTSVKYGTMACKNYEAAIAKLEKKYKPRFDITLQCKEYNIDILQESNVEAVNMFNRLRDKVNELAKESSDVIRAGATKDAIAVFDGKQSIKELVSGDFYTRVYKETLGKLQLDFSDKKDDDNSSGSSQKASEAAEGSSDKKDEIPSDAIYVKALVNTFRGNGQVFDKKIDSAFYNTCRDAVKRYSEKAKLILANVQNFESIARKLKITLRYDNLAENNEAVKTWYNQTNKLTKQMQLSISVERTYIACWDEYALNASNICKKCLGG